MSFFIKLFVFAGVGTILGLYLFGKFAGNLLSSPLEKRIENDPSSVWDAAGALEFSYWQPNAAERTELFQNVEQLDWAQLMRLNHLLCAEILAEGSGKEQLVDLECGHIDLPDGSLKEQLVTVVSKLISPSSPYHPQKGELVQGYDGSVFAGDVKNLSVTHLGALEVYACNEEGLPVRPEWIPYKDIEKLYMSSQSYDFLRVWVTYKDKRPKTIYLSPKRYGFSRQSPHQMDLDMSMTRFICHFEAQGSHLSIGIGMQDIQCSAEGGSSVMGLPRVQEAYFLDT